jgi:enoyl-CoA hydratase
MQERYDSLTIQPRADGVLLAGIRARQPGQTATRGLHRELGQVWRDIADDPAVRVAVLTGEGPAFMPCVDIDTQLADAGGFPEVTGLMKESLAIVNNIINCDKPIVSAINGAAGGAGLAPRSWLTSAWRAKTSS